MALDEKAMVVALNICAWTARKYDRKISEEVENIHKSRDAGRYNKLLIAKPSIRKLEKLASEARNFHYENTLPWLDNGGRLLPAANYFDYVKVIQEFRDKYENEVSDFIAMYPKLIEEAQYRLADMYNETDYPTIGEVEGKYSFKIQIYPVPTADDFRVNLNEEEINSIKEKIEQQVEDATESAMRDLWTRLFSVVGHLVERLSNRNNKFKDSLVTNIIELCKILPKLNITNDPDLSKLVEEVENKLTIHNPQTLREDITARNEIATEAQRILNKMRPYMSTI